MSLCDALCNPHDVPALLLLQTDVGIEDSKVELLHEGEHVDLHLRRTHAQELDEGGWVRMKPLSYLPLKKPVLQCLLPGVIACPGKDAGILLECRVVVVVVVGGGGGGGKIMKENN